MIKCAFLLGLSILLAGQIRSEEAVDESKPYGRAGVTVADSVAGTETLLAAASKPGPGRSVTVHLDANAPCEALVVAFGKKDDKLAFGWRPLFVSLAEWDEKVVGGERWPWAQGDEPFEVFVIFFHPGSAEAAKVRQLVAAMENPKADPRLLDAQTTKLHEFIGHAVADKDFSKFRAKAEPAEVAGVTRGNSFPWRDHAARANFTPERSAVVIVPSAAK